jgi:large subunit ribosomal protein L23
MHSSEVLRRPVLTEKTDALESQLNQYVFEVHPRAGKREIQEAAESIFGVRIVNVRTMLVPGKRRRWGRHMSRTPVWKKAVLTVAAGSEIKVFE